MGNNNFANLLVIHTGGVKVVVTLKMIAGDRNFFANGLKSHAMTLVNVSSYIDDTLHFINVLNVAQNMVISWSYSLINSQVTQILEKWEALVIL